jgi:thiamine transport system permease protein
MRRLEIQGAQRRKSSAKSLLLWIAPALFLATFYFYPLGNILTTSLGRSQQGVIANFIDAIRSPYIWRVAGFTIGQATLSTALTLLLGLPGAFLLARYEFRGKSLVQSLASIPFVMPTLVVATAFNALLGPKGWINLAAMDWLNMTAPPIRFVNTLTAILVAHVFYNITIVLRMVSDFWSHLDPRMSQAAQVSGASRWQTLRFVTLPLILPAIATATLLVFIFDFTSFGVILVLGGPHFATLEVEIYYQTISLFNLPLAASLSLLQLGCTLALTILYSRLSRKLARPLTLRPQRYTQKRLNTWRSRVMAISFLVVLLGLQTTPLVALAARSFLRAGPERGEQTSAPPQLTLQYYQELSSNRRETLFYAPPTTAISVSLGYALSTVMLSLVLGLPAAWALSQETRQTAPIVALTNRVLDPLLMLPLGTSAVTLGLGFIIALGRPPLDLRASPILVPLAHTLVAFPFVVRSLVPALRSIRPRLRQAALVMGASPRQVARYIDLPLVGRAMLVAATFAFTISLGEFGATALIARPEYPTIPVMIYRFLSQPGALNYGQALALSTILMAVTAGGMLAIERFRIAEVGEF